MLFWSNRRHELPLLTLPMQIQEETLNAARLAALFCFLNELTIMISNNGRIPLDLTRYTQCLTSEEWLGPDGHRGIAVSTQGPAGVWPVAPAAVWTGSGHIYRQVLGHDDTTLPALRAALPLLAEHELPDVSRLAAHSVPNLSVVIHLPETHG